METKAAKKAKPQVGFRDITEPTPKLAAVRNIKAEMQAKANQAISPKQKAEAYARSPGSVGRGQPAIAAPDSDDNEVIMADAPNPSKEQKTNPTTLTSTLKA